LTFGIDFRRLPRACCKIWTGLVKHGLVKHGLVKHGLVKHGLVKHGLVKHGLDLRANLLLMICFSICSPIYRETGKNTRIILLCSLAPAPTFAYLCFKYASF
jgi:hypothetical protein